MMNVTIPQVAKTAPSTNTATGKLPAQATRTQITPASITSAPTNCTAFQRFPVCSIVCTRDSLSSASRICPQCLHFLAVVRMISEQYGHCVHSASPSASDLCSAWESGGRTRPACGYRMPCISKHCNWPANEGSLERIVLFAGRADEPVAAEGRPRACRRVSQAVRVPIELKDGAL